MIIFLSMTTKAKIIVLDLFENYLNGKLLYVEGIDKNKKLQYTLPDYSLVFAKLYIIRNKMQICIILKC